jgi:hypothetical protein
MKSLDILRKNKRLAKRKKIKVLLKIKNEYKMR